MSAPTISYQNFRFPPQMIAHAVWLYFRLPLILRLVEEMLLERGIVVSYEQSGAGSMYGCPRSCKQFLERF